MCNAFQLGSCGGVDTAGMCKKNPKFAHQCAVCLQSSHGASSCTRDKAEAKKGAGKGKKGKKGK